MRAWVHQCQIQSNLSGNPASSLRDTVLMPRMSISSRNPRSSRSSLRASFLTLLAQCGHRRKEARCARHRPEQTLLYQIVEEHYAAFLAQFAAQERELRA